MRITSGLADGAWLKWWNWLAQPGIPASRVSKIDGEEYSCPSNQAQIDGMITILGRAGMDALASHFFKNDMPPEKEGEKAATKN